MRDMACSLAEGFTLSECRTRFSGERWRHCYALYLTSERWPRRRFYQRLLAADQEEAREIATGHLKDNSLESVYDSILIPALQLAERDHRINGLDDDSKRFVLRSTKELIEDLGDEMQESLSSDA